MLSLIKKKLFVVLKYPILKKIKILEINKNDSLFLFKLYNENIQKNKFFNKKTISYSEHCLWLNNQIKNKEYNFKIYYLGNVGSIRLKKIDTNSYNISIAILSKFNKKSIATIAMKKLLMLKILKNKKIYAQIKPENIISKRFFLKCGYKLNSHNTNTYIYINK